MVCGGQEWRRLAYCRPLPDDRAPHSAGTGFPWRNSEGRESAGSTTGSIASAWRWRHLEATDAPFTTWKPSRSNGLSTVVASGADAALNLTPDTAPVPGVGSGRAGGKDASATRRCAWITGRPGSLLATVTTATQLGRLGMLGSAKARGRDGRDGSYSRSLISAAVIAARSAAVLNHADQRAEDDARVAALTRDVELDRLVRLELTALLDLEEAERRQRILMRLHHEAGGRHRVGSQGGAQSRFSRVCRQYFGEPAHREPGRCCCGQPATSPRGASCDRCRERDRHYRRRYRAKVWRLRARLGDRELAQNRKLSIHA